MSLHLVRCNEPIGETGQNFTPENFPLAHDHNCDLIEGTLNGAGSAAGLGFDFFGNGRLVKNNLAAGAPEFTPAPALAVIVPEGAVLRVGGVEITLDEDVLLDGAPQNFTGYCVPSIEWDEVSESYLWSADWLVARPALGIGTLCKVTTNADEVLTINSSEADADIIPWLPVILARIRTLNTGGGEGGNPYIGQGPWLPAPEDSRQTSIVLQEKFDALGNRIDELESNTNAGRDHETKTDQVVSRVAILEQSSGRVHRDEARRQESAHVFEADDNVVYGTGLSGDRDFVGDGLQPDADGKFIP